MKTKTIIISLVAVATLALNGFAYFKYIRPQGNDKATGIVSAENYTQDQSLNFDSVKESLSGDGKWVKVTKKEIDPNYIIEDKNVNGDENSNTDDNSAAIEVMNDGENIAAGDNDSQDENMTVDPNDNQDEYLSADDNGAENNDVDIDINVDYVWVPNCNQQEDFSPYTNGSWQWCDEGWVWVSNYGWDCTYHYGRWWYSDVYGWVWSPGREWAPSWVDWCSSGGYYGWHPISPREHHHHGEWTENHHGHHHHHETTDPHWTFVPKKNFTGTVTTTNIVNGSKTKTSSTPVVNLNGDGVKYLGDGPNVKEFNNVKVTKVQKPVTNVEKNPKTKVDVNKNPVNTNGVKTAPPVDKNTIDKTKKVTIDKTKNVTINKGKVNEVSVNKNTNTIDKTKKVTTPKTKQDGNINKINVEKTKNVTVPKVKQDNSTPKSVNEKTKTITTPKVNQNTSKTEYKTQQPEVKKTYEAPKKEMKTYEAPKQEIKTYQAPKQETKSYQAPKQETKSYQAPKQEIKTYEAPKQETKTYQAPPVQKQAPVQKQVEQKPVIQKTEPVQKNDQKPKKGD